MEEARESVRSGVHPAALSHPGTSQLPGDAEARKLLHERVEGEDLDSFTDSDWRTAPRLSRFSSRFANGIMFSHHRPTKQFFKNQKAAHHLKFCPADVCRSWLPLHFFGTNLRMSDGLDRYCLRCNQRQSERQQKGRDKFEIFSQEFERDPYNTSRVREVYKRIDQAVLDARGRFKQKLPIDPEDVYQVLFGKGKLVCDITGHLLTPECFLNHHMLTFEVREHASREGCKVLDVICSEVHTLQA